MTGHGAKIGLLGRRMIEDMTLVGVCFVSNKVSWLALHRTVWRFAVIDAESPSAAPMYPSGLPLAAIQKAASIAPRNFVLGMAKVPGAAVVLSQQLAVYLR